MPYLSDRDIMNRLQEHLEDALEVYSDKDWFVIVVQGSQNYWMADEQSDLDSKLLLLPTLEDLVLNKKPISHTHIMSNEEHVDCKDTREYFKIFRKSNINFVEILFSDYWIANPKYLDLWLELRAKNEELARINPYAAVSCMKGMASEKLHALCHEYPSRMSWIEKYGFDPKQLSHLARINYFVKEYVDGKSYQNCIIPQPLYVRNWLLQGKRDGWGLNKEEAIEKANEFFNNIAKIADEFRQHNVNKNNEELDSFLNDVLYRLISRSLKEQLNV